MKVHILFFIMALLVSRLSLGIVNQESPTSFHLDDGGSYLFSGTYFKSNGNVDALSLGAVASFILNENANSRTDGLRFFNSGAPWATSVSRTPRIAFFEPLRV